MLNVERHINICPCLAAPPRRALPILTLRNIQSFFLINIAWLVLVLFSPFHVIDDSTFVFYTRSAIPRMACMFTGFIG
jgi:hypothetical protein